MVCLPQFSRMVSNHTVNRGSSLVSYHSNTFQISYILKCTQQKQFSCYALGFRFQSVAK